VVDDGHQHTASRMAARKPPQKNMIRSTIKTSPARRSHPAHDGTVGGIPSGSTLSRY